VPAAFQDRVPTGGSLPTKTKKKTRTTLRISRKGANLIIDVLNPAKTSPCGDVTIYLYDDPQEISITADARKALQQAEHNTKTWQFRVLSKRHMAWRGGKDNRIIVPLADIDIHPDGVTSIETWRTAKT
jgi:hypothetical protein